MQKIKHGRIVYTHKQIVDISKKIAKKLNNDFAKSKLITLVGLLKGAMPFMAELMKHLELDVRIDFITATSYKGDNQKSDELKMVMDLSHPVKGHDVIIIEDIAESGQTLAHVKKHIEAKEPKSVSTCVLIDKPSGRRVDFVVDYFGFKEPEEFLVGFGFDDNGYLRNLPYIAAVEGEQ